MDLKELKKRHKVILEEARKKLANLELEEVCKLMKQLDEINDKYIKEKRK